MTIRMEKLKVFLIINLANVFNKNYNFKNLVIAYEPVWAIGTNKTPSLEEIEKAHDYIKGFIL